MRETWAHAVLARLTYWTQQRPDRGQGSLLTHTHIYWHTYPQCLHTDKAATLLYGGVLNPGAQWREEKVSSDPDNRPWGVRAPTTLQVHFVRACVCVHTQLVCLLGVRPGQCVFVALYSSMIHNTPRADSTVVQLFLSLPQSFFVRPSLSLSLSLPPHCV